MKARLHRFACMLITLGIAFSAAGARAQCSQMDGGCLQRMIHAYEKIESLPPGTVATDSNTSHDAYALWATMRMFHEANAATIDESIILRDVAKRESRHEVSVNVSAVADMVVIGGCFPGVSLNQEIGVLRAYLEVHPEELDKPAFRVMARAFTRAYPCSSRAPSLVP